jgi:ribosome maturation factor RimP
MAHRSPAWATEVEALAAAVAGRHGLTLVGVDVLGEGRRTVVRVLVEGAGATSVEDCARVSEELSRALDLHDPIPHAYTLEVASPGLDRPLRSEADFVRFAGRKVEVTTRQPITGRRRWRGRLVGLEGGDVVLDVDAGRARLPLGTVAAARLVVEMEDLREDLDRGGRAGS